MDDIEDPTAPLFASRSAAAPSLNNYYALLEFVRVRPTMETQELHALRRRYPGWFPGREVEVPLHVALTAAQRGWCEIQLPDFLRPPMLEHCLQWELARLASSQDLETREAQTVQEAAAVARCDALASEGSRMEQALQQRAHLVAAPERGFRDTRLFGWTQRLAPGTPRVSLSDGANFSPVHPYSEEIFASLKAIAGPPFGAATAASTELGRRVEVSLGDLMRARHNRMLVEVRTVHQNGGDSDAARMALTTNLTCEERVYAKLILGDYLGQQYKRARLREEFESRARARDAGV